MAWIEPTHWFSFPKFRGENKQTFELPPPSLTFPFVYFLLVLVVHVRECKNQKVRPKVRPKGAWNCGTIGDFEHRGT